MTSAAHLKPVLMRMEPEVVAAIDAEAERLDRSRSWCVEHACNLWVKRLQRDRERRARKAAMR